MTNTPEQTVDPAVFRSVLGHYPTGVVVVTGVAADGEKLAMVMGSFMSVSLEPPLVSFMPMRTSRSWEKLKACGSMCVNVLTGEQEDVGRTIASRWENKFEGLECFDSPAGNPVLADSLAWIDVTLEETLEAGDHWIALCRVTQLEVLNPVSPLIFFQGGYGSFVIPSLVARIDAEIIGAVREATVARGELENLAAGIGCEASLLTAVNRDELATVGTAVGPGRNPAEGLGDRVPMVPPIGDSFMFAQDEQVQQYWLNKAKDVCEDRAAIFQERLARMARDGYLISFLPGDEDRPYDAMAEASRLYAQGKLTPALEQQIRSSIANTGIDYSHRELADDQTYEIGSIVVPVRDGQGQVTLTLRLGQLPSGADGAAVKQWIAEAVQAATRIESRLASQSTST